MPTDLARRLAPQQRATSPFTALWPRRTPAARWVQPRLAGEVAFTHEPASQRARPPAHGVFQIHDRAEFHNHQLAPVKVNRTATAAR